MTSCWFYVLRTLTSNQQLQHLVLLTLESLATRTDNQLDDALVAAVKQALTNQS